MDNNTDYNAQFVIFEIFPELINSSTPSEKLFNITQKVLKRKFPYQADIAGEVYARNVLPTRHSAGFAVESFKDILNKISKSFIENEHTTGGDFIPINIREKLSKLVLGKWVTKTFPVVCSLLIETLFLKKKSHNQILSPEEWHGLLCESAMTVISNGVMNYVLASAGPVGWAAWGAKLVVSGVVSYLSGKAGYDIGHRCSSLEQVNDVLFPNAHAFCSERNCVELFSFMDRCLDPLPPSIL